MKSTLAIAVVLSALLAAPSALAQFTDANSIIMSIGKSKFLHDAGRVDGASSVRVERLSTFMGASRAEARLARAEDVYARDLNYLHGNLVINPIAMQAIRAAGFDLDSIVALTMDSEGSAILYADDL